MRLLLLSSTLLFLLNSCSSQDPQEDNPTVDTVPPADTITIVEDEYVPVEWPFDEVPVSYSNTDVMLPEGLTYQILFREKLDMVTRADSQQFPAKGYHDMNAYLPIDGSSEHGWLFTSHESRKADPNLGDCGGGTIYEVKKDSTGWDVISDFHHVDFSGVGGTIRNCGGKVTPHGTILTAEELFPPSNLSIYYRGKGFLDTSDWNGLPRYQNMGFMVEVDPGTRKATQKLLAMGRFMHEDVYCMPDDKTVYLTDDFNPAVFFKFVADEAGDYSQGQLYAYKQSDDSLASGGSWITLPRDTASLLDIRNVAMGMGATIFIRHEWIAMHDGKFYITETGDDDYDWAKYIEMGAVPADYTANLKKPDTEHEYDDVHGRVLVFDPETMRMSVHLEGGVSPTDATKVFSNPDGCTIVDLYGTSWLFLSEDINWYSKGRVDSASEAKKIFYNELYALDLGIKNPTIDDLHRVAMGPKGCETTGGIFTPDGKTYFLNIMHPWPRNPAPFNRSVTIAIQGF